MNLGYISKVNKWQMDKDEFYDEDDYVGQSGLENYYEN